MYLHETDNTRDKTIRGSFYSTRNYVATFTLAILVFTLLSNVFSKNHLENGKMTLTNDEDSHNTQSL